MSVPGNRSLLGSGRQEFVHFTDTSNLVARGVDGEDEDENDRKEHGGVSAVLQEIQLTFCRDLINSAALLITEESGSHSTDDNVDSHTDRDQETCSDRVHSREIGDSCGTTQDKHGGNDNVRGQSEKIASIRNRTRQGSGSQRKLTQRRGKLRGRPFPNEHRRSRAKCKREEHEA